MANSLQNWPEPMGRVQSLADKGINTIPETFVKPIVDRQSSIDNLEHEVNIPIVDLANLDSSDVALRQSTLDHILEACREWGFFQVVNHGVSHQLMAATKNVWWEFFQLPPDVKEEYANSPTTYEGYGSRLGVEKGAKMDWSDYFYLHYLPVDMRNESKWPAQPLSCRDLVMKYGEEMVKLGDKLLKVLSVNLGLEEDYMQNAFGGDQIGATLRVGFYPKCPQPDLTLGLSSHSDPGGLTILLPDDHVYGLQVRKDDGWITVKPIPNAFVVNIGDQLQVLSNAKYKSVEHRVIVNSTEERVSLAFFYNPNGDILFEPAKQLITKDEPALYQPMKFNEYRMFMRTKGPSGKSQIESLKSAKQIMHPAFVD